MSILKAAWWHSALAMAGFNPGERMRPPMKRIPPKRSTREDSRAAYGGRDVHKVGKQTTSDGRRLS